MIVFKILYLTMIGIAGLSYLKGKHEIKNYIAVALLTIFTILAIY